MPLWFLSSLEFAKAQWKFFLGLALGIWLASSLHAVENFFQEKKWQNALEVQAKSYQESCKQNMLISNGVSDALNKNLSQIASRLADLKRLYPSGRVLLTPSSSGSNNATSTNRPTLKDAVAANDLWDYAGGAETLRQQLQACQTFIQQTWKAHDGNTR